MKSSLILFLLVSSLSLRQTIILKDKPKTELYDFLKGFLEGIEESTDKIYKLLKCIKSGDDIFIRINKAFEYISKMNKQSLTIGLQSLFESITELLKRINPCMEDFKQLKKLKKSLKAIDIEKIIKNIWLNPGDLFKYVKDGLRCFTYGDYSCIGLSTGSVIRILILNTIYAKEFLKGVAKGIKEKGDINKLIECVNEMSNIINEVVKGIMLIRKSEFMNKIEGWLRLFCAFRTLEKVIGPCSKGFTQLSRLISAMKNCSFRNVIKAIINNPLSVITDIIELINAFTTGHIYEIGNSIGNLLYTLFLSVPNNQ